MNYRHIYHAGNFADVFKHILVLMMVDYLQEKEKGLFLLDAFAGLGLYDLNSVEARKTEEFLAGVSKIMEQERINPDLRLYQNAVAPYWNYKQYPGSPLLLAEKLRYQDRLLANELHPEDVCELECVLATFPAARVTKVDAYESIRAHIPPSERRGLVLVDPPFEKKDEFDLLVRQMKEWKKRWETGCYVIWYPIKSHLAVDALHLAARDLGIKRTWVAEFLLRERSAPESLNGCGVLVFNTPFQIPERLAALAPELVSALGYGRIESYDLFVS